MIRHDAYRQYMNDNPWKAVSIGCASVVTQRKSTREDLFYWIVTNGYRVIRVIDCVVYYEPNLDRVTERKQYVIVKASSPSTIAALP